VCQLDLLFALAHLSPRRTNRHGSTLNENCHLCEPVATFDYSLNKRQSSRRILTRYSVVQKLHPRTYCTLHSLTFYCVWRNKAAPEKICAS